MQRPSSVTVLLFLAVLSREHACHAEATIVNIPSGLSVRQVTPCWRLPMVCEGELPRQAASTAGWMREVGSVALRRSHSFTTSSLSPACNVKTPCTAGLAEQTCIY